MRRSPLIANLPLNTVAGRAKAGPELYALHPCAYPSPYKPTNNKQTNNQRPLRPRDYRFPMGHPLHRLYKVPVITPDVKDEQQLSLDSELGASSKETIAKKEKKKRNKCPSRRRKERIFYAKRAAAKARSKITRRAAWEAKQQGNQSTGKLSSATGI